MQKITDTFQTGDGLRIQTVRWLPEATPEAIILLVHGIAEHAGRYEHVAETFTAPGYAVYSLDHRGHGNSEGDRAHLDSIDQAVDDLEVYYRNIRDDQPDTPIFVLGHSMGALISLHFVLRHQQDLAGWISSATPLYVDLETPRWLLGLGRILRRYLARVHLLPLDAMSISRDAAVVEAYNADPLVYRRPTRIGTGMSIVDAARAGRERLHELALPIYVVHGSSDRITPPEGSQYLYEHAGADDKTLKLYPGLYHELHNEPEKTEVLQEMIDWLNTIIKL